MQKKVTRLITNYRYKKYESCRQKFKENKILMVTICFRSFVLHKEVQGKFAAKLCDP
jgi:hypothetical protein